MSIVVESLIFFIIIFMVFSVGNYYFNLKRKYKLLTNKKKGKKNKEVNIMELNYLIIKFKLDINKMDLLYCMRIIAILDALIISLTSTIVFLIPGKIIWQLLSGFVLVFLLIYSIYELFGRYLVKKGWQK